MEHTHSDAQNSYTMHHLCKMRQSYHTQWMTPTQLLVHSIVRAGHAIKLDTEERYTHNDF